ncbi:MAG: hypothetical protein ACOCWL_02355, partial [Thermoguttaceae bacterium]
SRAGLYGDAAWVNLPKRFEFASVEFAPPPPPLPPFAIAADFERAPSGAPPARARVHVEGKGDSIGVTDEHAARGKRSLKMVDAPGLKHTFNPHFYYTPNHTRGISRVAFAMRLEEGVRMYHEWRMAEASPYRVGPTFHIHGDGKLRAAGRVLADLPPGEWIEIEIAAAVGEDADGTWSLTVTTAGREPQRFDNLPTGHADFAALTWIGWMSTATDRRVFYLDDIRVTPGEE